MTLGELLATAAAGLDGVTSTSSGDGETVWTRGADPFAVLQSDGTGAEFRLGPAVAAAAVRTPDTAVSSRGPGWVLVRPATLDAHAADRATAWFAAAYRLVRSG